MTNDSFEKRAEQKHGHSELIRSQHGTHTRPSRERLKPFDFLILSEGFLHKHSLCRVGKLDFPLAQGLFARPIPPAPWAKAGWGGFPVRIWFHSSTSKSARKHRQARVQSRHLHYPAAILYFFLFFYLFIFFFLLVHFRSDKNVRQILLQPSFMRLLLYIYYSNTMCFFLSCIM